MRKLLAELRDNLEPSDYRTPELSPSIARFKPRFDFQEAPVKVDKSEWMIHQDPERLVRHYEFDNGRKLRTFLLDVMDYEAEVKHSPEYLISGPSVTISLWTHDLERVTEIDLEFAKVIDEMFDDIEYKFLVRR